MNNVKKVMTSVLKDIRVRYFLAGAWNTLFGYGLMVYLYSIFNEKLHIVALAFSSSFIAISMSFITYKLFVYKTKGRWLAEWLRSFIVYGVATLFSIFLLWLFVEIVGINIYTSQALSSILVILGSYFGHQNFTFKKHE